MIRKERKRVKKLAKFSCIGSWLGITLIILFFVLGVTVTSTKVYMYLDLFSVLVTFIIFILYATSNESLRMEKLHLRRAKQEHYFNMCIDAFLDDNMERMKFIYDECLYQNSNLRAPLNGLFTAREYFIGDKEFATERLNNWKY